MTYGDPITAEEQRWDDELLKKGYIDQGYAVHWKNDSHAERIEFHREIVAIEKETGRCNSCSFYRSTTRLEPKRGWRREIAVTYGGDLAARGARGIDRPGCDPGMHFKP